MKVADWEHGYSITGAPLAVKNLVLTGVAGGEYGIRGFIRAYDARSGELRWTTYTVPGPGEPGNETWPGETWKHGGGSTWTTGAYDPELNRVYWNTGNAAPWNCQVRKGDNQWTASTIAIDPDRGAIRWGFQYTPGDCWDYDSTSTPVLVDLPIEGKPVKALLHYDSELDGVQYVAVPSRGIGGDMGFYYTEPKAGNFWVFALDGAPKRVPHSLNLVTIPGALPRVGEPGATLGGRVLPGYGFEAMEEREPIKK